MAKADMQDIRPKLWLGSCAAAADLKALSRQKVTHVLSVGSEFPSQLGLAALDDKECQERTVAGRSEEGCRYLREGNKKDPFVRLLVDVEDKGSADILKHFDECRMFIKEGLSQGGVLVHCCNGTSRSAAMVVAFLMHRDKLSIAAAVSSMKEKRPNANPFKFLEELSQLEGKLKIAPASPRSMVAAGLAKEKPVVPATVNPQVFLEVSFDGEAAGRVVIELFANIVPLTSENFRCLCTGEKGRGASGKRLNYLGSKFHRIIPGSACLGGDTTMGDGTGGESIYGHMFDDENFDAKHDSPGILSMANSGPNSNGSQFLICAKPAPQLDGTNVVFGRVISGYDVVEEMENTGGEEDGTPAKTITISECGEVEQKGQKVKRLKTEKLPVAHVLHILRKHSGLKKPTSWREEKISCSKEEAAIHLLGLRKQFTGLAPAELRGSFEEIARVHSDCKSAKKGGDIGPFEHDMMPKPFSDAAFALQVGKLSEVVSDKHGEHLMLRIA